MIQTKEELRYYLKKDKEALGISRQHPRIVGDDIWKFEIALRKHEYYHNCVTHCRGGIYKIMQCFWGFMHYKLGLRLGLQIPINVFDEGLRINHFGLIVVNSNARIGKFCDIHQGVNIGANTDGGTPCIGDNCWIGPGVKIFGGIHLGNSIMIGAGSVVNKDFKEDNITIAGVPARKIKDTGEPYHRK